MKQRTPRSPDARTESLQALAEQYAERHKAMENYILAWHTSFGLLRRMGIDPLSRRGRLANVLFVVILLLGVPLGVTAITGQWADAPILIWAVIAVVFGLLGMAIYRPFQDAIDTFLSLHRVMADESGLRRLIAWDRRWFDIRVTVPTSAAFAMVGLGLFLIPQRKLGANVPAGTIVMGAMLLYQIEEIIYAVLMLGLESRILSAYDYELYRLSPIDSVALQRSIRGSNRLGLLVGLVATVFLVGFMVLLPARSEMTIWMSLDALAGVYAAIGFGVVLPRLAMKRIVQAEKEREMMPLQRRLDHLSARLDELTEDEYQEMKRLKETHDIIRDSSENVLPISTIGQLVSSLILPTVAFVSAVAGDVFLSSLLGRVVP